jgi:hypothetical protein
MPVISLIIVAGCIGRSTNLPSSVTVELPDGTTVEAEAGSGAPSLADSQWQFFRTEGSAQSLAFATIHFGPQGELASFSDSTIASNIFGSEIIFDGQRHSARQKGLQYAASTYGAETATADGIAFEGRVTAFFGDFAVGNATASAAAAFDPEDSNIMVGTFAFSTRVTLIDIPEGNTDAEFSFIGRRVLEQE